MFISPRQEMLRCLFVAALLTSATGSAIAQSTDETPSMLGKTARQMLSQQARSQPDFVVRAPYVGIGFGRSALEPDTSMVPGLDLTEGDQVGGQITVGMDFGEWLSAEFHAAELGEAELSDDSSVAYREFGISALLYLGNNRDRFNRRGWNFYGRAGLGYLSNGVSEGAGYEQKESGQWILGAGTEYSTRSGFGIRAEGMVYDSDVTYLQIGLMYRFAKMPGGLSGIDDLGVSALATADLQREEVQRAQESQPEVIAAQVEQTEREQAERMSAEDSARTASLAKARADAEQAAREQLERERVELAEAQRLERARALVESEQAEQLAEQKRLELAEQARLEQAEAELLEAEQARMDRLAEAVRLQAEQAQLALVEEERIKALASAEPSAPTGRVQTELAKAEARVLAAQNARAENAAVAEQATSTAEPEQKEIVLNGVIEGLKFAPGSAQLQNSGRRILDRIATSLLEVPELKARINTHTDNVGDDQENLRLSEQRVLTIARYLVGQGVSKTMLEARAFGERRPVTTNETAAGRDKNGRVEIFLVRP